MTSHAKTKFKSGLMTASFNLNASADVRAILCMTNTTADTEEDAEFVGSITTLDEMDGANYARKTLAGEAVAADLTNNRGEFDFTDPVWSALGAGTRQVAGLLLLKFVTNDADSPAIAWIDSGGFPFSANGGDFTFQVNAEGAIQTT